jgi:hypothetical protein
MRKEVVTEYSVWKPTRVDSNKPNTELVDCEINNLKSTNKTKDGFYISMLNNLECFLVACKLRLEEQAYDPRVCLVTIWFRDDADISNYFRQVRKHIRYYQDANGKEDKEVVLYYHGQREKHSKTADLHIHLAIVFDSNSIKINTLRDLLRKPVSYFRKYTRQGKTTPKLPYVSFKLAPYQTDGNDEKATKSNPLATYGIRLGLPGAMQHLSYFCKVQQKLYVSKQPVSSKHSLNTYLRANDIDLPLPTVQPITATRYHDGELKVIRKAKALEEDQDEVQF